MLFSDRLDAEQRNAAMRQIRDAGWFGADQTVVSVSPHSTCGLGM